MYKYTKAQLTKAMENAYQAGDIDSAKKVAKMIKNMEYHVLPTDDMSKGEKLFSGIGKVFADTARGAADVVMDVLPVKGSAYQALQQNIANAKERDAALMADPYGLTGNIIGNIAAGAPTALIPGAGTIKGATAIAGGMGLLQPTVGDDINERLLNTAISAGGGFLGVKGLDAAKKLASGRISELAGRQVGRQVTDKVFKEAADAGYVIPPTTKDPDSIVGNVLEGWAGKIKTAQAASIKNMDVTDDLAKNVLGVPKKQPITPQSFEDAINKNLKYYDDIEVSGKIISDDKYIDEISSIINPYEELVSAFPSSRNIGLEKLTDDLLQDSFDSKILLAKIKQLRFQAGKNFKAIGDAEKNELADIQKNIADKLEDLIERNLSGDKIKNFREARRNLAKIYTLQDAYNPSTGRINAKVLGKKAANDEPLTDELKLIADFSNNAPQATQNITSSITSYSPFDVASSALVAAQNPSLASYLVARPFVRGLINSQLYQKSGLMNPSYRSGIAESIQGLLSDPMSQRLMYTATPSILRGIDQER